MKNKYIKNKELETILPKLLYNKNKESLITENDIKENDNRIIEYLEDLKETFYENFSIELFELICILITFIINKEKREKEIIIINELKNKYNELKNKYKIKEKEKKGEKKELIDLSISLKNKIFNFNKKINYGDSIINNLISGVKNNLKHNIIMTKLLDDEYKLNPYMIFLIIFCVFIISFIFIKLI